MRSAPSFDFSEALVRLKRGERLARRVWRDDRHIDVMRQINGRGSIVERRGYWHGTPWQAYDDDLLAEDWFVYDGPISNPRPASR